MKCLQSRGSVSKFVTNSFIGNIALFFKENQTRTKTFQELMLQSWPVVTMEVAEARG